ncbi:hypothetical protein N566_12105 [Streptomycetaceae bacterium MP113-05]|nr:hypothetical protein N566_12105 [Streptomycetaceae bacterium MP113-05]
MWALTHLLVLLVPATGRRRRTAPALSTAAPAAAMPAPQRRLREEDDWYPIVEDPCRVLPSALWRLTHEQRERLTALALALDGVDVGPWVIHGHRVGSPVSGVAAR